MKSLPLDELLEAAAFALAHKLNVISLGEGSNIVLADNLPGLVIKNRIQGVTYDAEVVHTAGGETGINWFAQPLVPGCLVWRTSL